MADGDQSEPVLKALGWLLVAIGGLWTVLAGGCTLVFIGGSVWSAMTTTASDAANVLMLALVFGGIGIAPGALILWGGIAILRRKPKPGGA